MIDATSVLSLVFVILRAALVVLILDGRVILSNVYAQLYFLEFMVIAYVYNLIIKNNKVRKGTRLVHA